MSLNWVAESMAVFGISELWMLKVVAVITATIVIHFLTSHLLVRVLKATKKTKSHWDDTLLIAALRPLPIVIWVVGITIALSIIGSHNKDALFDLIPVIREAGITICFAWFCWRLISIASEKYFLK